MERLFRGNRTIGGKQRELLVLLFSFVEDRDGLSPGRLLWEGTIPQDVHLGARVLTDSYVVAVDAVVPEAEAPYRAYFLDHRAAEGRLAAEGGILELGSFENVKVIAVRDNAILLATDRAIHGWCE